MARPSTTQQQRRPKAIELKRSHSYSAVAKILNISVSSVKAIVIKAGANNDNPHHARCSNYLNPLSRNKALR